MSSKLNPESRKKLEKICHQVISQMIKDRTSIWKKDKLGPKKGRHQDPQSGHYYYWEGYVESVWNMAYGVVSNELTYLQCSRMLTPMARKRGLR
tara:strand:- start:101 stop:382 length:282 start_codon:yes stop_codon:yes gene_type:complete